jgi:hypothetical protein
MNLRHVMLGKLIALPIKVVDMRSAHMLTYYSIFDAERRASEEYGVYPKDAVKNGVFCLLSRGRSAMAYKQSIAKIIEWEVQSANKEDRDSAI